ncbi:MAG TPA: biopolymer transporter ExbD [Chitinophagaceae bacterium]|jgi:biopolymer transport protein ExbD|nr:biopolymer transporter ExbD [Chitinophagaceae bacterium]
MPSVKIPRKSTDFDMTPFVDVAFLILSFFMLATKFKPPEPVEVTTPNSVSADALKEGDAVLITMDKDNKIYFSISLASAEDQGVFDDIIQNLNKDKNLNLTNAEMGNFRKTYFIGVPFSQLKSLLDVPVDQQKNLKQPGIPVDTSGGELTYWIQYAKSAFAGRRLAYMIKGDDNAKYPAFEGVIAALKRNEQFKYNLITSPEAAPEGTELYKQRQNALKSK